MACVPCLINIRQSSRRHGGCIVDSGSIICRTRVAGGQVRLTKRDDMGFGRQRVANGGDCARASDKSRLRTARRIDLSELVNKYGSRRALNPLSR